MALCVSADAYGNLIANNTPVGDCLDFVLLAATEYTPITDGGFNSDLFLYISGALLINFVVGHTTGRIIRLMSKA